MFKKLKDADHQVHEYCYHVVTQAVDRDQVNWLHGEEVLVDEDSNPDCEVEHETWYYEDNRLQWSVPGNQRLQSFIT